MAARAEPAPLLPGIIYPLTLAGAALLAAPLAAARWNRLRVGLLVVLMVGVVGLRVPQVRATADCYIYFVQHHRVVLRQSEAKALRAVVGDEPVDVALGHCSDNHLALVELAAQGVSVRLRSPAWDRSLKNWAQGPGGPNSPTPNLLAPKARFSLVERNAYAPPGTERWVGSRLKLIEDWDAVSVLGVADAQDMTWDKDWRPGVWIGNTRTTFLIHNGTGEARAVRLLGDTSAGPAHPDRERRTLRYQLGNQSGTLSLSKENTAAILLRLAPGLNHIELSVDEPADPPTKPKQPVPLLEFRNWRLESAAALSRSEAR